MIPGVSADLDTSLYMREGDTWCGIPAFSITVNKAVPSDDVVSVVMQFRKDEQTDSYELQITGPTQITFVANDWTFAIPKQALALVYKDTPYIWGLKITDAAGVALTYLEGTMTVGRRRVLATVP